MNYILLHGSSSAHHLWVCKTWSLTKTKRIADDCSFASSLPTNILCCKQRRKESKCQIWLNLHHRPRESRTILSCQGALNKLTEGLFCQWEIPRQQRSILDEEDRVCQWCTAHHHHQSWKMIYNDGSSVPAVCTSTLRIFHKCALLVSGMTFVFES